MELGLLSFLKYNFLFYTEHIVKYRKGWAVIGPDS